MNTTDSSAPTQPEDAAQRVEPSAPANNDETKSQIWSDLTSQKFTTESCKTVAAIRAVNSEDVSLPSFHEPLAAYLAGDEWVQIIKNRFVQAGTFGKGVWHHVSFRCQLVDEAILNACREKGIAQVVLLGAGMDTRPYRLDLPHVKWFEVDVAHMSHYKQEKLSNVPPELKEHTMLKTMTHHYIQLDLSISLSQLVPTLEAAGFDQRQPVLYVMEGLVYYLNEQDNLNLLNALPQATNNKDVYSQAIVTCVPSLLLSHVRDPAMQAKNHVSKIFAGSWKLSLDDYVKVVQESKHWILDQEVNIVQEGIENRGYSMPDSIYNLDRFLASERLLYLKMQVN